MFLEHKSGVVSIVLTDGKICKDLANNVTEGEINGVINNSDFVLLIKGQLALEDSSFWLRTLRDLFFKTQVASVWLIPEQKPQEIICIELMKNKAR
jgi:hypothetical protein